MYSKKIFIYWVKIVFSLLTKIWKCILLFKICNLSNLWILLLAPGGLYPTLNPQEKYGPPPSSNPPGTYVYRPEKSEEEDVFGGCLDKVGLAVGGLVAAGGVAAAMHALNVITYLEQI